MLVLEGDILQIALHIDIILNMKVLELKFIITQHFFSWLIEKGLIDMVSQLNMFSQKKTRLANSEIKFFLLMEEIYSELNL